MNKELPKVFANKIDKKINNSQDIFYEEEKKGEINDVRNIGRKISDIFNSSNFVYKSKVRITTYDKTFTKTIVGRKNNYLLTMDNEAINIDNILDIEQI